MRSLLETGSGPARDCLAKQKGTIAARNSCRGPWTSNANLSISLNPMKVRMPQRATLSFSVSNPLGAADLLLHGENNLKGWGQFTFVDPTLLYVRGFDSAAKRFRYEVNPRFGSTNPQFNSFRAPVTLTMQVRVDVGPTRERQQLTQQLDRGRKRQGQKTPEFMLKAMYGSGGIINPLAQLLRQVRQRRHRGAEVVRRELFVERLQHAMVEDALVAVMDLQLALGMIDVLHAQDVLEEELLRAFAEVLELGGGEGAVEGDRADVAVEDGAGARANNQLELALRFVRRDAFSVLSGSLG
jgi:hypothetical protein